VNRRFDLTDQEWAGLAPLLPAMTPQRGGRWRDHRQVLNGILFRVRTGVPWRDLPERYGPWETVYKRFARWQTDGTWARIEASLQTQADGAGELHWDAQVDSTVVRAHQHAAGALKGAPSIQASRQQALGRSRGGLTTKLHTICDGRGRNLATRLTPGQDADTSELVGLVDAVRVARPGGRGRPRVRPDHLTADKATAAAPTGRRCEPATSPTPSPNATIRRPTAPVVVLLAAGRQPSTESATAAGIRSSG
jgi:transposase